MSTCDLAGIVTAPTVRASFAKRGLNWLDAALVGAHDQVAGVEQDLQAFDSDLEQNRLLLTAVSSKSGPSLRPLSATVGFLSC